jgi:hypothetical protein
VFHRLQDPGKFKNRSAGADNYGIGSLYKIGCGAGNFPFFFNLDKLLFVDGLFRSVGINDRTTPAGAE